MLRRLIGEDVESGHPAARPPLAQVRADPGQVEQVVLNLAVNARDAMPGGGKLIVETADVELGEELTRGLRPSWYPARYVLLCVSDTGQGMDADTRERACSSPSSPPRRRGRAPGWGFSTVYGIVKQSGGYVWIDSERAGQRHPRAHATCRRWARRRPPGGRRLAAAPTPAGRGDGAAGRGRGDGAPLAVRVLRRGGYTRAGGAPTARQALDGGARPRRPASTCW